MQQCIGSGRQRRIAPLAGDIRHTLAVGRPGQRRGLAGEPRDLTNRAAARKDEIMLAQQKVVLQKNRELVGKSIKVLLDETNPRKKTAIGRCAGQAPDIDGRVVVKKCTAGPGELVTVKISDFNYYDLLGEMAAPATRKMESRKTPVGVRLSLPVMGVISGVEAAGKRRAV